MKPDSPLPAGAQTHRRVLMLALPIILSNLSVPLVGLVDTAVMGRLDDPAYIGAVALGATVFAFLFWAFGFLRMGTTGMVSQAWGRRDGQAMRDVIMRNCVLAMVFGGLILLLRLPLVQLAAWAFPASEVVETAMRQYYQIRVFSAPATLLNYVMVGVFVGMQRTSFVLVAQLVLNLTNAALSIVFVLGLGWGIEGVAIASVIAEYLALICSVLLLRRVLVGLSGQWPVDSVFSLNRYLPLLSLNADIFVRTLCLIFGFAWFNAKSAGFGDVTLAGNAVIMQLVHLLAYGLDGFAHAAESLVGGAVGSKRRDEFRWAIRATTQWAALTAFAYTVVFAVFGTDMVALLTTIESVRVQAGEYLLWLIAMPLIAVWSYQLDGIFVGALRTRQMRNAMVLATGLYLLFSWPAIAWGGNHGLWLAIAVFYVLRAATLGWFLRHGDWRGVADGSANST
ncbi:MAG: MATE family efflux transporter [Burkholderiaceae bacterium]